MFGLGMPELVVILGIAFLLFGGKKLPEIGAGLGRGISSFKKGLREADQEAVPPKQLAGAEVTPARQQLVEAEVAAPGQQVVEAELVALRQQLAEAKKEIEEVKKGQGKSVSV